MAAGPALGQTRPLPDRDAFLREVRTRLDTNDDRLSGYSYVETTRRVKLDGGGRPAGESIRIAESYPGLPGEPRWERVLEEDGRRTPDADLRKLDLERQRKAEAYARRLPRQSDADRARDEREAAKRRAERAAQVDDVFRAFDITLLGRDMLDGHDTVVVSLTPRPDARTRTRLGGFLKFFRGRAWISESDHELARLEVETTRTVSVGLGLLGRVHEGTRAAFDRRRSADGAWLPTRSEYTFSGRFLLLRRIRQGGTILFSNYRRFTVDTSQTFSPSVAP